MKQPQNDIIEQAGIEIVGGEYGFTTINEELQTRKLTQCKINRSLDNLKGGNNYDVFEFSFDDLHSMRDENASYIRELLALKEKISPYNHIEPKCSDKFEPGAILTDSWGWEQTNIDFYCVVKRAGNWLTVLPMTKLTSAEVGFMTNHEMPGKIDFSQDAARKKLKLDSKGNEYGFSFRDYSGGGFCRLWDGEKETSTHYA